ncbi:hypothetical protein [Ruegeria marina]|uniref:hypothetical protein n=1 Tax=Ruegeria marina TaxID=639004 RepID=UPI001FE09F44|nr:hypothetical protein [Ruegeria marina]
MSSIRRLVSEEGRLETRETSVSTARPGKLVLTPALRVADRDEDVSEASAVSDRENRQEATEKREPVAPWSNPEATLYSAAEAAGKDIDDLAESKEPEAFAEQAHGDEALDVPLDEQDEAEPETTLSARIEVLEAVIAQTDDDWEPDGLSEEAYSGTRGAAMEWQDHLEREATPDPQTDGADKLACFDPVPRDETEDEFESGEHDIVDERSILSPEDGYLDEESLRELVADIVREELQGALGERITRNVRKLVRREIHRALTAQEFE